MKVAVTGGKTGGHVYPAVAVMDYLRRQGRDVAVLWLGLKDNLEERVASQRGWEFQPLHLTGVRGAGLSAFSAIFRIIVGTVSALSSLRQFAPDVLMATGGYVSVPGTLAAWLLRLPILLFLPDVKPGWAVRFLRRFASVVAVTSPESTRHMGRTRTAVTGYPVRDDFFLADPEEARRRFGLGNGPVLLVLGGSSGARNINAAVLPLLPHLLERVQVIHIAGRLDYEAIKAEVMKSGVPEKGYYLYEYLDDLPQAMVAADLVVSRAGASTLGELTAAGKPAIVIPGEFAGGHQNANARYLNESGVAVVVADKEVGQRLGTVIESLLSDSARLAGMSARAKALAQPDATARLARLLVSLAEGEAIVS